MEQDAPEPNTKGRRVVPFSFLDERRGGENGHCRCFEGGKPVFIGSLRTTSRLNDRIARKLAAFRVA